MTFHRRNRFVRNGKPWNLFIFSQSVVQLVLYLYFLSCRSLLGIGFKLRMFCFQYFLRLVQSRMYMQKCNSLNVIDGTVNSGVSVGKKAFKIWPKNCRFLTCIKLGIEYTKQMDYWKYLSFNFFNLFSFPNFQETPLNILLYEKFTNLWRCEIAQAGIGAINGSLLNNAVARLAITQVIWSQAILTIEYASVDQDKNGLWFWKGALGWGRCIETGTLEKPGF